MLSVEPDDGIKQIIHDYFTDKSGFPAYILPMERNYKAIVIGDSSGKLVEFMSRFYKVVLNALLGNYIRLENDCIHNSRIHRISSFRDLLEISKDADILVISNINELSIFKNEVNVDECLKSLLDVAVPGSIIAIFNSVDIHGRIGIYNANKRLTIQRRIGYHKKVLCYMDSPFPTHKYISYDSTKIIHGKIYKDIIPRFIADRFNINNLVILSKERIGSDIVRHSFIWKAVNAINKDAVINWIKCDRDAIVISAKMPERDVFIRMPINERGAKKCENNFDKLIAIGKEVKSIRFPDPIEKKVYGDISFYVESALQGINLESLNFNNRSTFINALDIYNNISWKYTDSMMMQIMNKNIDKYRDALEIKINEGGICEYDGLIDNIFAYIRKHIKYISNKSNISIIHGDFSRGNIIYNPEKNEYGLIDWEYSFNGWFREIDILFYLFFDENSIITTEEKHSDRIYRFINGTFRNDEMQYLEKYIPSFINDPSCRLYYMIVFWLHYVVFLRGNKMALYDRKWWESYYANILYALNEKIKTSLQLSHP